MASRKGFGAVTGRGDVGKPCGAIRAVEGGACTAIVWGADALVDGLILLAIDMLWDEDSDRLQRRTGGGTRWVQQERNYATNESFKCRERRQCSHKLPNM